MSVGIVSGMHLGGHLMMFAPVHEGSYNANYQYQYPSTDKGHKCPLSLGAMY